VPCLSVWPPEAALRWLSSRALSSAQAMTVEQITKRGRRSFKGQKEKRLEIGTNIEADNPASL